MIMLCRITYVVARGRSEINTIKYTYVHLKNFNALRWMKLIEALTFEKKCLKYEPPSDRQPFEIDF